MRKFFPAALMFGNAFGYVFNPEYWDMYLLGCGLWAIMYLGECIAEGKENE